MRESKGEPTREAADDVPAEVLRLISLGEARGYVVEQEVEEAFAACPLGTAVLADLSEQLAAHGIVVRSREEEPRESGVPPGAHAARPEPSRPFPEGEPDLVRMYLDEIGRTEMLGSEEEYALALRVKQDDAEARKKLILAHLKLVVSIARHYQRRGLEFLDLVEEGNIGLIRAVDRFRPESGFRLSTYAGWWIRQSIARAVANRGRTIRVPIHVIHLVGRYVRARRELERELGRAPSDGELSEVLHEDASRLEEISRLLGGIRSLDAPTSGESLLRLAESASRSSLSAEELVDLQLQNQELIELLTKLGMRDKRDESVIRIRYGFGDGAPHTLAEIGEKLGISRERVRQIEARALADLRRLLEVAERAAGRSPGEKARPTARRAAGKRPGDEG